jgi:hypothetical protein
MHRKLKSNTKKTTNNATPTANPPTAGRGHAPAGVTLSSVLRANFPRLVEHMAINDFEKFDVSANFRMYPLRGGHP